MLLTSGTGADLRPFPHEFLNGDGLMIQFGLSILAFLFEHSLCFGKLVDLVKQSLVVPVESFAAIVLEDIELILHFNSPAIVEVIVLQRQLYLQTLYLIQKLTVDLLYLDVFIHVKLGFLVC